MLTSLQKRAQNLLLDAHLVFSALMVPRSRGRLRAEAVGRAAKRAHAPFPAQAKSNCLQGSPPGIETKFMVPKNWISWWTFHVGKPLIFLFYISLVDGSPIGISLCSWNIDDIWRISKNHRLIVAESMNNNANRLAFPTMFGNRRKGTSIENWCFHWRQNVHY